MKKEIKLLIHWIFLLFTALPLFLAYRILFFSSPKCFTSISELISLFPGYFGYFLRQTFYRLSIKSSKNFDVGFGTIIQYSSAMIGSNVYIGQNCNIAKCAINSGVKIGSGVHIVNKNTHDIGKNGDVLPTNIKKLKRVFIGRNTWIGNGCVIMADIGDNCVIGAGSVVTKLIPDNSVAVGNPAKVIRKQLN